MPSQVQIAATRSESDALVGTVFSDNYRVIARLGEGGMGVVYLANHVATGRELALKILHDEYDTQPQLVDAFVEEARTVARLGHENIIDIFYGGRSAEGRVFLAMEYLQGWDLASVLHARGPLSWNRARTIFLQVAQALSVVHKAGLSHGDLKPANIFITRRGERNDFVKVLDFGAAHMGGHLQKQRPSQAFQVTPQYTAPEQTRGEPIDARSDVYSLGCVMYHMLTGTVPFEAADAIEMMARHSVDPVEPPSLRAPELNIPPAVETVIMRALEKDPRRRYQTMAEMEEAIARCRFITTTTSVPTLPQVQTPLRIEDPPPRKRTWLWPVVGVSLLAVAAVVAALAF